MQSKILGTIADELLKDLEDDLVSISLEVAEIDCGRSGENTEYELISILKRSMFAAWRAQDLRAYISQTCFGTGWFMWDPNDIKVDFLDRGIWEKRYYAAGQL